MVEFNRKLEIINGLVEINEYDSIFSICNRIINENYSPNEKAQIYFIMASTYKELEKYTDALVSYTNCIMLDNNEDAYIRKSELLFKLNRFEAALLCCKQGLLIFKDNTLLIEIKKQCQIQLGELSLEDVKDTSDIVEVNAATKLSDIKVAPIANRKKMTLLISVSLFALLTFIFVFLFAYKSFSSSDKAAANLKKSQLKNGVKKEIAKSDHEKQGEQTKTEEKVESGKSLYLVKGEIPTDPFEASFDGNPSYIFPKSNSVKLSYNDLLNKTLDELYVARNEIFSRHGYVFTVNSKLNTYFRAKSWYKPDPSATAHTENDIELSNSEIIKQVEVSRIAHYTYGDKTIDGFVIKDSDSRNITKDEISSLKYWELIIARNEILARHGMTFGIPQVNDHFKVKSWYKPVEKFNGTTITTLEFNNIKIIKAEENRRYSQTLKR